MKMGSVAVVVLGDFGRSPRMQYHALSLSRLHKEVSVVAYPGERPIPEVEASSAIRRYNLSTPFAGWSRKLFLVWAPLKVLFQVFQLLFTLLWLIPKPQAILVQNPPSIPTLAIVWLACRLRGASMVLDWHNFGYTVLGLSLGSASHPLVRVARVYERFFAGRADVHLCVTKAMKEWLRENWGVAAATVVYDKPPPFFARCTPQQRAELFARIPELATAGLVEAAPAAKKGGKTAAAPALLAERPALVVSSTSWTEDEDFGVLLEALVMYNQAVETQRAGGHVYLPASAAGGATAAAAPAESKASPAPRRRRAASTTRARAASAAHAAAEEPDDAAADALVAVQGRLPDLHVVVTGKGPLKSFYMSKAAGLALAHVRIVSAWLEPADYPRLLGAADLGVCLHFSTSGLDLPMKVVDMFGAGLPVAAVAYPCLGELVRPGVNGVVFPRDSPSTLAAHFFALLAGFGAQQQEPQPGAGAGAAAATPALAALARGVAAFQAVRWQDNWDATVRRHFEH